MKTTILLSFLLGLAGAFGLNSPATPASDGAERPAETEKKTRTKKKPTLEPGESGDSGSVQRLVDCWCDGGADGNGPAQCQADDCDSADSCCVTAYGEGAEASDQ